MLFSLGLSVVAIYFVMPHDIDWAKLSQLVRIDVLGVVLLLLALFTWWASAGWRIQLLAGDLGAKVSLSRATRAFILGMFSGILTPAAAGGSVAIGWYLSRYLSAKQAAAIAVYGFALDLVFYAWALPVSFVVLSSNGVNFGVPGLAIYVGLIASGALTFALALMYFSTPFSRLIWRVFSWRWLMRWRRGMYGFVRRTARVLARLRSLPWPLQLRLHVATAASFVVHFAVLNGVALALSIPVHHLNVLAIQILVVALGLVVPTPGGAGYMEFALGRVLRQQVPDEAVVPLVLAFRVFSYWLYFVLGPFIGGAALLRSTARDANVNVHVSK